MKKQKNKATIPKILSFKIWEDDSDYSAKKAVIFGIGSDNKMYTWNPFTCKWNIYGDKTTKSTKE